MSTWALSVVAALGVCSCAATVLPLDGGDGSASLGDSPGHTDGAGHADARVTRCRVDTVRDGDRCASVHDSCLTNESCGYTACDCGVDGMWHCQTVGCPTTDGGR